MEKEQFLALLQENEVKNALKELFQSFDPEELTFLKGEVTGSSVQNSQEKSVNKDSDSQESKAEGENDSESATGNEKQVKLKENEALAESQADENLQLAEEAFKELEMIKKVNESLISKNAEQGRTLEELEQALQRTEEHLRTTELKVEESKLDVKQGEESNQTLVLQLTEIQNQYDEKARDWVKVSEEKQDLILEKSELKVQMATLVEECTKYKSLYETTESSLQTTEKSLQTTKNALNASQLTLKTTENSLEATKNTLKTTKGILEQTQSSLKITESSLTHSEDSVEKTSSKLLLAETQNNVLQTENIELKEKLNIILEEIAVFRVYQSLEFDTKEALVPVYKGAKRVDEFTVRGVGKNDIEKLYDVIFHRIMAKNFKDLEKLQEIFLYFVDLFNRKNNENVFTLDTVKLGDDFNPLKHTKCMDSQQSGAVARIYLRGFTYQSSQQSSEKRSIVRVKNS